MAKHAYVPGATIGRHGRVPLANAFDEDDRGAFESDAQRGAHEGAAPVAAEPSFESQRASAGSDAESRHPASPDPSITADLTQPLESMPVEPTPAPAPRYGQYGQAPEEAPRYAVPPTPVYDTREEPVSFRSWFLAILLASIPFVNIVALIVYGFGRTQFASQRNWAKAMLVWAVIVSLASVFLTYIGILHPANWAAIL